MGTKSGLFLDSTDSLQAENHKSEREVDATRQSTLSV